MKLVFSAQALADLEHIADYYRMHASPAVAEAVARRVRQVLTRIAHAPESAPRLVQRPAVRVVPLIRYPYKIFYRVAGEGIDILHIRHTSRKLWEGER
ncbi:MAG: type II toxin-antitoxin system RelE/ParE family toxin [Stellaceae bacterium]